MASQVQGNRMSQYRVTIATALVVLLAGCPGHKNVECRDNGSCDLSGGGMCIAATSGNNWCAYPDPQCPSGYRFSDQDVGDGLGGQCPAGDIEIDPDAAVEQEDARPDAVWPMVTTFQQADLVIGQPDFVSSSDNAGGGVSSPTAKSIYYPDGACSDGAVLYIVDEGNDRVFFFYTATT